MDRRIEKKVSKTQLAMFAVAAIVILAGAWWAVRRLDQNAKWRSRDRAGPSGTSRK